MSTVEKLDRLIADQLQAALPVAIIGREIIVLEQTSSTNDAILRVASPSGGLVRRRVPEGLVVFAEHQTARARSAWEPLGINRGKRSLVFNPVTTRDPAQRLGTAHDLGDRSHLGCDSQRVRP